MDILFDVFKDIDKGVKLPKDWNGQLVLIFNEAITNAVKHSKCKAISASFIYKNSLLEFALVDDGKGFDVEQVLNKNGLSNMRQRASRIGGCIDIESSIKGTKVVFRGKISITD